MRLAEYTYFLQIGEDVKRITVHLADALPEKNDERIDIRELDHALRPSPSQVRISGIKRLHRYITKPQLAITTFWKSGGMLVTRYDLVDLILKEYPDGNMPNVLDMVKITQEARDGAKRIGGLKQTWKMEL